MQPTLVRSSKQKNNSVHRHTGLYLPAPGFIRFDIVVPEAGELRLMPVYSPPEVQRKQRSDGAALTLQIHAGDESVTLDTLSLKVGTLLSHRFNLSRWAGQSISLAFKVSFPGASNDADFCFIANPNHQQSSFPAQTRLLDICGYPTPRPLGYLRVPSEHLCYRFMGQNRDNVHPSTEHRTWTLPSQKH